MISIHQPIMPHFRNSRTDLFKINFTFVSKVTAFITQDSVRNFIKYFFIVKVLPEDRTSIQKKGKVIFMKYSEAMEYIESRRGLGYSMGLGNIEALCEKLGNPQDKLQFIHVAGTNGKGSVSAYLTSILMANGYQAGTYSSPSVFSYEEKMRFQGKPVSKVLLAKLMEQVKEAVTAIEQEGIVPSMFEVETALAFLFFSDRKCDYVVLEAGLGGLEDATNVVKNTIVAVLASISYDHMEYLGDTLYKIAQNKAAIIKPGSIAVTMEQDEDIIRAVRESAQNQGAKVRIAALSEAKAVKYGLQKQSFSYHNYNKAEIQLLGKYQISNAILALEVCDALKEQGVELSEEAVRKGLYDTEWPGRFSVIAKKPYFIMDGAHNADAALKLSETIEFYFTNKKIIYIMGILKDKEYDDIIRNTYRHATHIITVATPNKERTMSAFELAKVCEQYHPSVTAADSIEEAVEMSYLLAGKDDVIIAFGSLSYLGRVREAVNNKDKMGSDSHGKSEQS